MRSNFPYPPMLVNYFTIAIRHLRRAKTFAAINVLGLSVSITAFLLIMQYVIFQLSFDDIHKNKDEIYRVAFEQYENNELKNNSARNFVGIQHLIRENFPEVSACTGFDRTSANAGFYFAYKGKGFYASEPFYQTDSDFFLVFPSLLASGDPASVLKDPHDLVISEKMARQIFGNTNPIGMRLENRSPSYADVPDFVITGILKDIPENSHFHLSFVALIHKDEVTIPNYWTSPKLYTYLTINKETDRNKITERLNHLLKDFEKEQPETRGTRMVLQRISDIHLLSNLHDELETNGNKILTYILFSIGIAILVLAWINYVNLETARFVSRTKQLGVRRVLGSDKSEIAFQLMVEYFCLTALAGILAFFLFTFILPYFTYLTGVPVDRFQWAKPEAWILGASLFFAGTIIAGIYPAFFLSKINLIAILKGKFSGMASGSSIRKSLIVVQFMSSIALVAFVLVINGQLDYMRLSNKKIDIDNVISVRNPSVYANDNDSINHAEFNVLKNKLLENHSIKNVTSASAIPGADIDEYFTNRLKRNLSDPNDPTRYKILFVDYDFIPVYGLKLKYGRNYSIKMGDEENWNNIILNEKAIHQLGFSSVSEAINQEINFHLWGDNFEKYKIIGIVEDYHQEAVKEAIDPVVLSLNHSRFQQVYYSIKLNAGVSLKDGLACVEKSWRTVFPDKPFEYYFQDDYYDRQFKSEVHFERIFTAFSGVALFIASLGIFGLSLFEASFRLKEISIRKVLGATVSNLIILLSKGYLKLITVSAVVAMPLIYYVASEWLANYPEHIELNLLFFFLPLAMVVMLVAAVSGIQMMTVASSKPIDNLKCE
jgi:putative ABC transport system permease protein